MGTLSAGGRTVFQAYRFFQRSPAGATEGEYRGVSNGVGEGARALVNMAIFDSGIRARAKPSRRSSSIKACQASLAASPSAASRRNSLIPIGKSLFWLQKFPVPLHREFARKAAKSLGT